MLKTLQNNLKEAIINIENTKILRDIKERKKSFHEN